jgi:hypothetical protein
MSAQVTNNATDARPSNPLSSFAHTKLKPALGPSFTFLTDTTLWLARAQDIGLGDELSAPQNIDNDTAGSCTILNKSPNPHHSLHIAEVLRSRSSVSPFRCQLSLAELPLLMSSISFLPIHRSYTFPTLLRFTFFAASNLPRDRKFWVCP